jgi:hypothetical protein
MNDETPIRITAEAFRALAEWKAFFAEEVSRHAAALARDDKPAGLVTIEHYRAAAIIAAGSLGQAIEGSSKDGDREAA